MRGLADRCLLSGICVQRVSVGIELKGPVLFDRNSVWHSVSHGPTVERCSLFVGRAVHNELPNRTCRVPDVAANSGTAAQLGRSVRRRYSRPWRVEASPLLCASAELAKAASGKQHSEFADIGTLLGCALVPNSCCTMSLARCCCSVRS